MYLESYTLNQKIFIAKTFFCFESYCCSKICNECDIHIEPPSGITYCSVKQFVVTRNVGHMSSCTSETVGEA